MTIHPFDALKPRGKTPSTVRALEKWIQDSERLLGVGSRRVGWLVASGVLIAAIQRRLHQDGLPRFLLKGGAYLELRLGLSARATKDVDTLFRGDFDEFLVELDRALSEPFEPITFERTEPERIEIPGRLLKPYRLDVRLKIRGRTWRRIRLEISPDEGAVGAAVDLFTPPSLAHFGLSTPATAAGLVIEYQIAQKLHACTDPHTDEHPNDRVRDVVDILLLRAALFDDNSNLQPLAAACSDLFDARGSEALAAGNVVLRTWPCQIEKHRHWRADYNAYAHETGLNLSFDEAVDELNGWIREMIGQA